MTDVYQGFDNRLSRIGRNRGRMAQGYTSHIGRDGLIVFRPRRRREGFPFKGLAMLVIGIFCFKGLILAHLGDAVYTARVDMLAAGSPAEQVGAFMMQSDPVSLSIAHYVRPFIK